MPDTAHDCPVLRTGVGCTKDILEIEILWKGENFYCLYILFASHKTTVIFLPFFYLCEEEQKQSARMEWQKMTGKFRKVASHYAPESAKGLFLNLPEDAVPWNPGRQCYEVLFLKCPPDIPFTDS